MPDASRIRFGPFVFDRREARLWRDGSPVDVTPRALGILDALIERQGELVTKEELVARVWPRTIVTDAAVSKRVQELRSALGDDPRAPRFVETLYGRGFKFVIEAVVADDRTGSFVGREQSLEQLMRAQRAALQGERGLVLVTGQAGIGKSQLLAQFLDVCASGGVCVARGHCSPYGQDEPYGPVIEVLASIEAAMPTEYHAALRRHAPSWIGFLTNDGTATGPPVAQNRHMLVLELTALLCALAEGRALVLAFEDLHWSDPSTLIALDTLVRQTRPAHLLVAATLRDGALGSDAPAWRSMVGQLGRVGRSEVRLTRFTLAEVQELLTARLGPEPAARLAVTVLRRAEGLPLYVAWLAEWIADAAVADAAFPDSLIRLFELQLTALRSDAVELIEAASVLGLEFSAEALAKLCDRPVPATEALLREVLRESGVLAIARSNPHRFAFAHALLHETLHSRIDPIRAQRLHRCCAEALLSERTYDAAEVARHLAIAGDVARAAEMRLKAARAALQKHSYVEAQRLYEAALQELHAVSVSSEQRHFEIDAMLSLAQCLIATEGYTQPRVKEVYEAAHAMSDGAVQRYAAIQGTVGYLVMRGQLADAARHDHALFEAARACRDEVTLARAFATRAEHRLYRGGLADAEADLVEAERLLTSCDSDARRLDSWWRANVSVQQYASQIACERADFGSALVRREAIFALISRDPNPYLECVACYFSAAVHLVRDELDSAAVQTARMHELARTHAFGQLLVWAETVQGHLLCCAGEYLRGVAAMREGLALLDASGTRLSRALVLGVLALGVARSGALDEALALFDEADAHIADTGERLREPQVLLYRADALIASGHAREVEVREALEHSLASARSIGSRISVLRALTRIVSRSRDRADELREVLATIREGSDAPIVRAALLALD